MNAKVIGMRSNSISRIGKGSSVLLVLILLLQVSVNSQEKVAPKAGPQSRAVQTLEPRFRVALDQIHERTGFRTVLIQLDEEYFNLCDLKLVFSHIRKTFPALFLKVSAYSDPLTLEAMVKFQINQRKYGAVEYESSSAGLAARTARLKEMGYPERIEGRVATYFWDDRFDTIEHYIDYMPDPQSSKFERVILR